MLNSKGKLLALMAMGCMFANPQSGGYYDSLSTDDIKHLDKVREQKRLQRLKEQGIKEWHIDGFIVWARNEKNAIRKVNNAKKLLNDNT